MDRRFERNGSLLKTQLMAMLVPVVIASVMSNISNTVDSIIAGRLLGAAALSAVSLVGATAGQLHYTAVLLVGIGTSAAITAHKTGSQTRRADTVFNSALRLTAAGSVLLALLELLFARRIIGLFTTDAELTALSLHYYYPLIAYIPFELTTGLLTYLYIIEGSPRELMRMSILSAALNLVLDIAFVRYTKLGITGLELSTIISSAVYLVLLVRSFARSSTLKLEISLHPNLRDEAHNAVRIIEGGFSPAFASAMVLIISAALCASVLRFGASESMAVFSVFIKFRNLVCLVTDGILQAMAILVCILYVEKDDEGVRVVMLRTFVVTLVSVGILTAAAELFPQALLRLYGVGEAARSVFYINMLRLALLSYLAAGITAVISKYFSAIGQDKPAGLCAAIHCVLTLCMLFILSRRMGERGFWITAACSEYLSLLVWAGMLLVRRGVRGERFFGTLFLRREENEMLALSYTGDSGDISAVTEQIQEILESEGINRKLAYKTAAATDELSRYAAGDGGENELFDLRIKYDGEEMLLALRNDGAPIDFDFDRADYDDYEKLDSNTFSFLLTKKLYCRRVFGINCIVASVGTGVDIDLFEKIPDMVIRKPLEPLEADKVDMIVLHHMAREGEVKEIEQEHLDKGWDAIAYNFWVAYDGTVYEARGFRKGAGVAENNSHIISIGFQGDYQTQSRRMPDEQFDAGVDIIRYCLGKLPNAKTVVGHSHFGNTTCPGRYFPLEEMIRLKKRVDLLTLVNTREPLPPDYVPKNLVELSDIPNGIGLYMNEEAYRALRNMSAAARLRGHSIWVSRAYEYSWEKEYYGEAEHQTGLAVDISYPHSDIPIKPNYEEYRWLIRNSYKFGYIQRYPRGRENITGHSFDPAHFRYVGLAAAKEMFEKKLTLEEYLEK